MILTEKTYDGVVTNIKNERHQFMMEANAKAFETLSSSLYQDKIGSIVRELSCNALDSHIQAGKADVPFSIHLPSIFEPYFSVKDYGIGMDEDTVKSVFTVLFASTKDQSNDTVGAFGLGAKTPFSYTESFTVISRKNGVETSYAMMKDEDGLPCYSKIASKQTTECNGVEIVLPVNDQYDRQNFKTAIQNQLKFFTVRPQIVGGDYGDFSWASAPSNLMAEHNNVQIYYDGNSTYSGAYAVMGPVGYQINFDLLSKRFPKHATMLNHLRNQYGVFIRFNFKIGEVSVTPSRETLSYDEKRTYPAFERALEGLHDSLSKSFHEGMKACTSIEERKEYLRLNYHKARNLVGKVDVSAYDFGIWEYNLYSNITFYVSTKRLMDDLVTSIGLCTPYSYSKNNTNSNNALQDTDVVIIIDNCKYIKRRINAIPDQRGPVLLTIDYSKIDELKDYLRNNNINFKLLSEYEPVKSEKNYSYLTTEGYRINVELRVHDQLLRDMSAAKRITDKNEIEPGYFLSSHRGNVHAIENLYKYTLYKQAGLIKDDVKFIHVFPEKSAAKLADDEDWSNFQTYLDSFDFKKLYDDNVSLAKYSQVISTLDKTANECVTEYYRKHYDISATITSLQKDLLAHLNVTSNITVDNEIQADALRVIYGDIFRSLYYSARNLFCKLQEHLHTNYPLLRSINNYYLTPDLKGLKEYIEMIDEKNGGKADISKILNFDEVKKLLD